MFYKLGRDQPVRHQGDSSTGSTIVKLNDKYIH